MLHLDTITHDGAPDAVQRVEIMDTSECIPTEVSLAVT